MPNLNVLSSLHASINNKLCRYEFERIPVDETVCSHSNEVEDESHHSMRFHLYNDTRNQHTVAISHHILKYHTCQIC